MQIRMAFNVQKGGGGVLGTVASAFAQLPPRVPLSQDPSASGTTTYIEKTEITPWTEVGEHRS